MNKIKFLQIFLILLLAIPLFTAPKAFLAGKNLATFRLSPLQGSTIKLLSPEGKTNPVVNMGNTIKLQVLDSNNQPVTGFTVESGNTNVVTIVDAAQGIVMGKNPGYATVTVRRGNITGSSFVIVTKVNKGKGAKVLGQVDQDISGATYLTDPIKNQIFKVDDVQQPAVIYAGTGTKGKVDGEKLRQAQFAGPIGISIDDRSRSGIFIADTLNHSIRKVGFDNTVQTMLGTGSPGVSGTLLNSDEVTFANPTDITLNAPQGVAVDTGGNIFVADTDNNAIYFVDFSKSKIQLVAGQPGRSGKQDGKKRDALFNSPTSISLSPDGTILNVVDSGNNVIRQVSRDGSVTTLGAATPPKNLAQSLAKMSSEELYWQSSAVQDFKFNKPLSVFQDLFGAIYVSDQDGVDVIFPTKNGRDRVPLAQGGGATFVFPVSVSVRGTQVFVSDAGASSNDEAFKIVTIGPPVIKSMSKSSDDLEGGSEVILKGENFGPETQVFIGDSEVTDLDVVDANTIRLTVPRQKTPGKRTLTLQTRGGMTQTSFTVTAKPLSQLIPGEITTIAGGIPFIGDGGPARSSVLFSPSSLAIDGMGNILIADEGNNRVRKINTRSGLISTIAGTGAADFSGDKDSAIVASLNKPTGLAVDLEGNIYIADRGNARVRRIDAVTGNIDTIIGSGKRKIDGRDPQEGIDATKATIDPIALAVSPNGKSIFIVDNINDRIRLYDRDKRQVFTFAGTGVKGFNGDNISPKAANLNNPTDIALTSKGVVLVDRGNLRVRQISFNFDNTGMIIGVGNISTIAGCGSPSGNCRAIDNIPATQAVVDPLAVDVSATGEIVIAETRNNGAIRRVLSNGIITTIAGGPQANKDADSGIATEIKLISRAIAVIGESNLIIAESDNLNSGIGKNRIRVLSTKVDPVRGRVPFIDTIAGTGIANIGDNDVATNASLNAALSLAVDEQGNIFIADLGNRRVREITGFDRKIVTVAGGVLFDGRSIGDGGRAMDAPLFAPIGVATDGVKLIIADAGVEQRSSTLLDSRIRQVVIAGPSGTITTVAGGGQTSTDNASALSIKLDSAINVAVDKNGNLFILEVSDSKGEDNAGGRVRRVDAKTGVIQTIAGTGETGFAGDGGPALTAKFNKPIAITLDKMGNLYIADSGNDRVRKVDAITRLITTVIGGGTNNDEGALATQAKLNKPLGVLVDDFGNIFVSDTASSRVRVVEAKTGKIRTVAGRGKSDVGGDGGAATSAGLRLPTGLTMDKAGNLYIADVGNSSIRAIKGPLVAENKPQPRITSANYSKSSLTINGMNFAPINSVIMINGEDKSDKVIARTVNTISLKGNKKKLGLEKGRDNVIIIVADGVASPPFLFRLSKGLSDQVE